VSAENAALIGEPGHVTDFGATVVAVQHAQWAETVFGMVYRLDGVCGFTHAQVSTNGVLLEDGTVRSSDVSDKVRDDLFELTDSPG